MAGCAVNAANSALCRGGQSQRQLLPLAAPKTQAKRSVDGVGVVGAYAVARRRARRKNAYDRQFDKGRKIAEKLPPNPARYIAIISRFFLSPHRRVRATNRLILYCTILERERIGVTRTFFSSGLDGVRLYYRR